MRTVHFLCALFATMLLLSAPVQAHERRDYISDRLGEWIEHAEDLGYRIIETEIETITSSRRFHFDLGPGTYHTYAEGGRRVEDLDMAVYDRRGRELASDYMADNYPVASFTLHDWEDVEIELTVYSFEGRPSSGYYCFVLAREDDWRGGRDRWDRGRRDDHGWRQRHRDRDQEWEWEGDYWNDWDDWDDWDNEWRDDYWTDWDEDWQCWDGRHDEWWCDRDGDWPRRERRRYVENRLDDLREYAHHRRMRPIMDDVTEIEDRETYEMTLHRGRYVLFAVGGPWIDDLDLHVYDDDGWMIAEDIDLDAAPAVWFRLSHRTRVEIEVEVWSFAGFHDEDYFGLLLCED